MGRRRILLAAFALVSVAGLTGLKPSQGVCVKRNIMFWRTQIEATPLRDNLYMLKVYGTDLINANTVALIGSEGVLLVDPGHPEMLGKLRAAMPRVGGGRIRVVLNTHPHPDPTWALEYAHFKALCANPPPADLSRDLWLQKTLRRLGAQAVKMAGSA